MAYTPDEQTILQSQIEYPGNGTQALFTFPFTYMQQSDICVETYDEPEREWSKTTTDLWAFVNATTIEFATPPAATTNIYESNVANVRIRRITNLNPLAQFNPGSAIRAVDLNDNFDKLKLAIEENRASISDLPNGYWTKTSSDTTYSDNTWESEADNEHIPTTEAVNVQLDDLRTYVDTQDTADRAYTDEQIAQERATTEAEIAAEPVSPEVATIIFIFFLFKSSASYINPITCMAISLNAKVGP